MPAAYHSAPVVRCHSVQAGTATVVKAAKNTAARKSCPHMRSPWKTVWPPRSVEPPIPRMSVSPIGGGSPPGGGGKRGPGRGGLGRSEPPALAAGAPHPMMEGMNMTGTFNGPPPPRDASRPTPAERAVVLGGFALAALATALSVATGAGIETIAAAWLAAGAWAFVSSLALALRRGLRDRDWSAFRRAELSDGREDRLDWSLQSGRYAYMRIAEDNERLMRGD